MKRKTAIYCRSALYDEIAVARQEAQCRKYAHAVGIEDEDIDVYRDCGASGATLGRPAMNALTADITAGNVGAVIASALARIARNFALLSEWRELLRAYGVKLVTLSDGEIGNGLTYSLAGDYLLPNIILSDPPDATPLGY
jgi:DNA invertase Pin-like site-specific DNA recombinase